VVVPPAEFLRELRVLCREHGALLIADEVMTGLGRSGRLFASAHAEPDLICLGKGLGGGLPISACLGAAELMHAWGDPDGEALHTGTFCGNPLSCAAALAVLAEVQRERLTERAARLGASLGAALEQRLGERARAVRASGLLVGIELANGDLGLRVMRRLLELGYIVVPAGRDARVISLTPALNVDEALLDGFVEVLGGVLEEHA
jgi:4-aminobutyrate aminotransferase/(S)-3-amino-2-methylpropionate transaminase